MNTDKDPTQGLLDSNRSFEFEVKNKALINDNKSASGGSGDSVEISRMEQPDAENDGQCSSGRSGRSGSNNSNQSSQQMGVSMSVDGLSSESYRSQEMSKTFWKFESSMKMAMPVSLCYLLQNLVDVINFSMVSYQKPVETSQLDEIVQNQTGLGLAQAVILTLATPIIQGLNDVLEKSFMETNLFASQVKRDNNKRLNQGRMLLLIYFIPVAALLVKCDILLKFVGQPKQAVDKTQNFLYLNFLALFINAQLDLLQRYVRSFEFKKVTIIGNALTLIVHYFAAQQFVLKWQMGLTGIAIANTISALFNLLLQYFLVNVVFRSQLNDLFNWPDKSIFSCEDCDFLLKSSLVRIFQNLLEFWTLPLLVFWSISQGQTAQIAMILIVNIILVFYSLGQGFHFTSYNELSKALSHGCPDWELKNFCKLFVTVCLCINLLFATLISFLSPQIFSFYTNNEDQKKSATILILTGCIIMVIKSFNYSLLGILRAAQYKKRVFFVNLLMNFAVYGLSILLLVNKFDKKSLGYLYAYLITNALILLAYVLMITMINWHEQSTVRVQGMNHSLMLNQPSNDNDDDLYQMNTAVE